MNKVISNQPIQPINFEAIEFEGSGPYGFTADSFRWIKASKQFIKKRILDTGLIIMKDNSYQPKEVNLTKIIIWFFVTGIILTLIVAVTIISFMLGQAQAENEFYRNKVEKLVEQKEKEDNIQKAAQLSEQLQKKMADKEKENNKSAKQ